MAADLMSRGFAVNLFEMPEFADNLRTIFETQTIRATGVVHGTFRLNLVTTDLASAIDGRTMDLLQAYHWPGNVRELQNLIQRAVVLSENGMLTVQESWLRKDRSSRRGGSLAVSLIDQERELIEEALAECMGRVSGALGAAVRLGVPRSTLESKIRSLGIDKQRFKSQAAPAAS